jgi:hypothetical protein
MAIDVTRETKGETDMTGLLPIAALPSELEDGDEIPF